MERTLYEYTTIDAEPATEATPGATQAFSPGPHHGAYIFTVAGDERLAVTKEIAQREAAERRHGVYTMPDGSKWDSGKLEAAAPDADSAARKAAPVYSGVLRYFPDALAEVARLSYAGNAKHNPGEPLHWAREKSTDELDALARHLIDCGKIDPDDGFLHDVKVAWRALANLQRLLEKQRA